MTKDAPAKYVEQLQKHTLLLYEGEYHRLQEYYPEMGAAIVVRKLVRKHLKELDKQHESKTPVMEVEI